MPVRGVDEIGTAAFLEIEDNLETVEQNVLAERVENTRRGDRFPVFTFAQTRPRGAGRLGEHGRHTHPLRLAVAADLVNRMQATSYFFCVCGQIAFRSSVAFFSAALYSATSVLYAMLPCTSL